MRLTNDCQYEPEKEEEQISKKEPPKKPDKKELPKKITKDDLKEFHEWVNKKEKDINRELFEKNFNFQRPTDMLKTVYTTNDEKKSNGLVNAIKNLKI